MKPISDFRRARARNLRESATVPEKKSWCALKRIPLYGTHFRKQVPIGSYIADFACLSAKLIIELDGSQHGLSANKLHDKTRTDWLQSEGYQVLRFWNNEITQNLDHVLETIQIHLNHYSKTDLNIHPTPALMRRPSPSRGG